jgi:hypothetical protein
MRRRKKTKEFLFLTHLIPKMNFSLSSKLLLHRLLMFKPFKSMLRISFGLRNIAESLFKLEMRVTNEVSNFFSFFESFVTCRSTFRVHPFQIQVPCWTKVSCFCCRNSFIIFIAKCRMRRRIGSESENSITQVIVEEQEQEFYKDKIVPAANLANKFFKNFIKSESQSLPPPSSSVTNGIYSDDFQDEPEVEFVMTARDRTVEFANTIRSLQGRNINRAVNLRDPKKVKQIQNYSEFMMIAKNIGKNIASTYAKLEKLTLRK